MTERPPAGDLRTFSRGGADSTAAGRGRDGATAAGSSIRPPPFPWKTRVLLPLGVLLCVLLLLGYAARDVILPARAVTVIPVVLKPIPDASASRDDSASTDGATGVTGGGAPAAPTAAVQAPGWVEADPFAISVSALADGVVKEMLALEGQAIKAGEVVVRLVDDDAKLALAKAEAELAQRQAALEAARREWDNPVERTRAVATAEAMVAQTAATLEKLVAEIDVESAKLALAKEEFARTEESTRARASSEIDLIRARQQHQAQQATLAATQAQKPVLSAELAQRQAELTAARDNLQLRIEEARTLAEAEAMAKLAQAARDEAALRLARMEVRAPVDGVVMQRHVTPGSKVMLASDDMLSASVVHLYDPKKLQVRVDVPLADAAKVGVGQPAEIVVGVLPERTFKGRVVRVLHEADIQKNTLQVKVAIDDPSPQLKPEMLARVRVLGAAPAPAKSSAAATATATTRPSGGGGGAQAIFAPARLVHRHGDHASAYIVDRGRNVAVHKTVQLGAARIGDWVEIAAGLNVGDALIADPKGISDGQRIRITGEADDAGGGGGSHGAEHQEGHENHGTH